jgi:nitroreductase
MLTVGEAIRQRRSIRSFRPDPVPEEHILEMLEAARLAPSGGNSQPWRFLVVTDTEEKKKLRQVSVEQEFVETAPVVFVCATDMKAYSRRARNRRFQEFIDFGVLETLSGDFADPEYRKQYESRAANIDQATLIQMAVANTYIAIEHLVLTATALGLGSCWVGAVDQGEVRDFFNLPQNVIIVALVPVGYPTKVPPLRPRVAMEEILLRPVGAVAGA